MGYLEENLNITIYTFLNWDTTILHKKFQVILSKIKDVMAVFVIENFFIYAFKISFTILGYLEAKFDYDYFILFLA